MGDFLKRQYENTFFGDNPEQEKPEKESKLKKAINFVLATAFVLFVGVYAIKGLEYLTEKTRQVRLDADYTEEMLRTYRD